MGIVYPTVVPIVAQMLNQKDWIVGHYQNIWEWSAFMLPQCLQHWTGTWENLLFIYGVMKLCVKIFQPLILHLLELVDECYALHMECESSSEMTIFYSYSHFILMYSVLFLLCFWRPWEILESILIFILIFIMIILLFNLILSYFILLFLSISLIVEIIFIFVINCIIIVLLYLLSFSFYFY